MQLQRTDGVKSAARASELRQLLSWCKSRFELSKGCSVAEVVRMIESTMLVLQAQSKEIAFAERKARRFQAELLLAIGDEGESV